ncbi:hypothetical protein [Dietzia alimentaria]|uniref:hypothetical protein n=1 Tax=Dietzia alimentaria TaxID=665550 RepID=UPI00029B39C4|nr:hypothetical protein [Dietzia alimentaria]
MAPTEVVSVNDGPRITINDLVGSPKLVPTKIIQMLANQFLSESLLRDAGPNVNGMVSYNESTPLYLDEGPEPVAEFSEIPVTAGAIGLPKIAVSQKLARGIRVSKEMIDEGRLDLAQTQITQLVNTFIRNDDRALRYLLSHSAIPEIPASAAWTDGLGNPRHDIAAAMEKVGSASLSGDVEEDDTMGFVADTVVLPASITPVLMDNDKFIDVYKDSLATEDLRYTGKLPNQIMGMNALQSRSWPLDRVLVVERRTVGFFSDTRALQSTAMYPEGGGPNGGPTESWRSDTSRKRVNGIDQPLAACWITGIKG